MCRWVSVLIVTFLAATAAASGPAAAWTGATAEGGLSPLQENAVQLVKAKVDITVRQDDTFDVIGAYELDNPGRRSQLLFGVPFRLGGDWENSWGGVGWDRKAAWRQPKSVEIELAGVAYPCRLAKRGKPPKLAPPQTAEEVFAGVTFPEYLVQRVVWCTTSVAIPPGRHTLALSYRGELFYQDMESSFSEEIEESPRTLWYPSRPAKYWTGRPESLELTVHLAPGVSTKEIELLHRDKAKKPVRRDRQLKWTFKKVDLTTLGDLRMVFDDASEESNARQWATWNGGGSGHQRRWMKARASSSLAPGKKYNFDPKKAVDGKATTAWCEGAAGTGVGEWIEIITDFSHDEDDSCYLQSLVVVPGYTSSQKTYRANGRVKAFRTSRCDKPHAGKTTRLKPHYRHDLAPVLLWSDTPNGDVAHPLTGLEEGEGSDIPLVDLEVVRSGCFRLTILEVEAGDKYEDTCIAEIAPVYYCG